jgi:hypothetical protein
MPGTAGKNVFLFYPLSLNVYYAHVGQRCNAGALFNLLLFV